MSENYLDLVTNFIMETALSGGGAPSTVVGLIGDQAKAAYWVKQANAQIQREWRNWDFLWGRVDDATLGEDSTTIPGVLETQGENEVQIINFIKQKSLAIMVEGSAHFPEFQDWNNSDFSRLWTYETQTANNYPAFWSMRPDRVIVVSSPFESAGLTAKYEYLRKPKPLLVDDDVPLVPDDFTRLIVVLAKIMYAEHEDAPEVMEGAQGEYDFLLSEMEAAHLPDQGFNRESHSDADLVVTPE